jgi:hypothetical protein
MFACDSTDMRRFRSESSGLPRAARRTSDLTVVWNRRTRAHER